MKLLVYLGHPAHYHTLSHLLPQWAKEGHEPLLVARDKDVLLTLLEGLPYRTIKISGRKGNSWWSIFWGTLRREWKIFRLTLKEQPAVLIGTDITIAHAGYWTGTPSLLLNEDDSKAVPRLAHLGFRYATKVIAPQVCDIAPYEKKKLAYEGIQEIAYLHPERFQPERERVQDLFPADGSPYVILRVSALQAHHDKGIRGLDLRLLKELLERITPKARVWISSESSLEKELEAYRFPIPPEEMHHAIAHAHLFIGDSQTMTAEAAVLGTPSIRFSDLSGQLSYLDKLERDHDLTFGFSTDQEEAMMKKVEELLERSDLKIEWGGKRDAFLEESDDPLDLIRKTVNEILDKGNREKRLGL